MREDMKIICGSAGRLLGREVARLLDQTPAACVVERFSDGEVNVRLEEPVRGREIYIVQSTCPPVDKHLVELLVVADACRRASASKVIAVVPYFGYGRADKRSGRRTPITGRMVAALMETVGINHLLTLDLHSPQMEGFFQIPVETVTAVPALCHVLQESVKGETVVVSPDEGRVKMAAEYANGSKKGEESPSAGKPRRRCGRKVVLMKDTIKWLGVVSSRGIPESVRIRSQPCPGWRKENHERCK